MIEAIRGKLLAKEPMYVRVDVNGIGYGVHVPVSTYERLGQPGSEVQLYTYLHVREELLQLYGFHEARQRGLFAMLLSVSGVGPRIALGILSVLSVDEFRRAIKSDDVRVLTSIPGVGKKTAQRVVLELRERLPAGVAREEETGAGPPRGQLESEAVAALISLGSRSTEAARAVREAREQLGSEARLEDIVKFALKHL